MRFFEIALSCLALPYGGHGADHPSARFANEQVEARVYLPDPENGYLYDLMDSAYGAAEIRA